MFQIEDLVAAAFNGGSFDLDAIDLLEMTNAVSLQVDKLLLQYVAGPDNVRLLPYRPAEMLSPCIGDLEGQGFNQRILDMAQTATGMGSISKLTIQPKMSLMMGSIEAVRQSVTYLVTIGFSAAGVVRAQPSVPVIPPVTNVHRTIAGAPVRSFASLTAENEADNRESSSTECN